MQKKLKISENFCISQGITYCAVSHVFKKFQEVGVFSSADPNSQVNSELRAPWSKQAERIRQAAIFGMSRFVIF